MATDSFDDGLEAAWRELGESVSGRLVSKKEAAAARERIAHLFPRVDLAVSFQEKAANRKLGPVRMVRSAGVRLSPQGAPPFVSSTYVAIGPTCPDSCSFKRNGCFVEAGFTGGRARAMDAAAEGRTALEVIRAEVLAIDRAFGGREIPDDGAGGRRALRIHAGGDCASIEGAELLAAAAKRWRARGGGSVWTFTHWWRLVPRAAWGGISVLASCDRVAEVAEAIALGYVPALVVPRFKGRRAFKVKGWDGKLIPCPAETGKTTCVDCRLCLDAPLARLRRGIAFEVHGPQAERASEKLTQLRRR